jgi:hypothetical protein
MKSIIQVFILYFLYKKYNIDRYIILSWPGGTAMTRHSATAGNKKTPGKKQVIVEAISANDN